MGKKGNTHRNNQSTLHNVNAKSIQSTTKSKKFSINDRLQKFRKLVTESDGPITNTEILTKLNDKTVNVKCKGSVPPNNKTSIRSCSKSAPQSTRPAVPHQTKHPSNFVPKIIQNCSSPAVPEQTKNATNFVSKIMQNCSESVPQSTRPVVPEQTRNAAIFGSKINQNSSKSVPRSTNHPAIAHKSKNTANFVSRIIKKVSSLAPQAFKNNLHLGSTKSRNLSGLVPQNNKQLASCLAESSKNICRVATPSSSKVSSLHKSILNLDTSLPSTSRNFDVISNSTEKLSIAASNVEENESMEWDTIEETAVLKCDNVKNDVRETFSETKNKSLQDLRTSDISVVVDTNILLRDLSLISKIGNIKTDSNGTRKIYVIVPWMVLEELDYQKDDKIRSKLQVKAQQAIKFINAALSSENSFIKGQTIIDAFKGPPSKNADDGILNCCFQMKEKSETILLSNDINLRNKAIISGMKAESEETIINSLQKMDRSDNLETNPVKKLMGNVLNHIIEDALNSGYGAVWKKFDLLKNGPPWTFGLCLTIMKKYWQAVFSLKLQKQALKHLEDFREGEDDQAKLLRFCLSLLLYLKNGFHEHSVRIEQCVSELEQFT